MKSKLLRSVLLLSFSLFFLSLACGCGKDSEVGNSEAPVYANYNTYAFFGTDSRAVGEEWKTDDSTGTQGAPSSDVIMVLAVNNDTGEVRIVSVFRDTMLDVSGDGSDLETCNTAYRESGVYGAIDMLEKNLDLHIDGYVTANFKTVADAIDLLGGVVVDVEDEAATSGDQEKYHVSNVVEAMNKYIDEMNSVYDSETPHIEKAGKQILSGLQAVAYSRVRITAGADMRRTERQRNIVMLMVQKLREADTETQHRVLKDMYSKIDTDLTENELSKLFDNTIGYDLNSVGGFPYMMGNLIDEEKGDMLVPCDLESNVIKLHGFLYDNEEYEPSSTVKEYSKLIIDESGFTAEDADDRLSSY